MSNSDSDVEKTSGSNGSPEPSSSRRPKRSAPRQSVVETDSSGSEDDAAVKIAKMKAKRAKKSSRESSEEGFSNNGEKKETLNELDREMLAYQQMQEQEIKKKREEIRQSLMNKNKSKKGGKKDDDEFNHEDYSSSSESEGEIRESKRATKKQQSVEDEDPDMDYHRPSEVSAKRNKKKAMDELLNKRRDKKEAEEKRKEQEKSRAVLDIDEIFGGVGTRSSSSSSSRSSSRSSSADSRSPSPESRKEIESLDDLQKAKISRTNLARFVHLPFFNKLAIGCFVRVGIGENNGRSVYRVAEITDVVETAKVYTVENTRTNKGIKLRHANDQRVYRLEFVSNQPFSENEWSRWVTAMKSKNLSLPTVDAVESKRKEIEHYKTYNLASTEIDYMIKEKARFLNAPTNFAVEKSRLMKAKSEAEEQGDLTRAKDLQREIDELDAKADDLEHQRNAKLAGVTLINQKRRVEMKQNFLDPTKMKYDPIRQDDPFTRKSNRTKLVAGSSKKNKESEAATESQSSQGDSQPSQSNETLNQVTIIKKLQSTTVTTLNKPANNITQFSAHSIELDLDI